MILIYPRHVPWEVYVVNVPSPKLHKLCNTINSSSSVMKKMLCGGAN